jgi:hypothetical protein
VIDIIDMHIDETLTTQEQAAQEMKKTRKHQKLKKILLQSHVEGGRGQTGFPKYISALLGRGKINMN